LVRLLALAGPLGRTALLLARNEVGVREMPPGSNRGPRVEQYQRGLYDDGEGYLIGQRWCGRFARWCFEFAAQRLLTDRPKSEPARVKLAYERIFNRTPSDTEIEAALAFVKTKPTPKEGWSALCQSLWASHEFLARS
jgi:hypothetical protein